MAALQRKEPEPFFPALAPFYASVSDLWYPLIRVTVGAILLQHGWIKVTHAGVGGVTSFMAKSGFVPAEPFAIAAMFLETVGAACIVLGLLTRVFAAAIAVEMAIITFTIMLPRGGFADMQYTLMWGIIMFAIALRGGGPYSLDRAIGKEI
jgi:putative oxidoreductase